MGRRPVGKVAGPDTVEARYAFLFRSLLDRINQLFSGPLEYCQQILSFNNSRNCIVHTNGSVTERHCNSGNKDNLQIKDLRFKIFFKKGMKKY
jgi:hypothetical protein